MADYLIGDVQGCYDSLQSLLKKINFSLDKDQLFFLGDVINRGDKSLETLAFIKAHTDNTSMVLGNHDFHLLACAFGTITPNKKDTFTDILQANNSTELLEFLLQQPLIIKHKEVFMVHAGIPPNWNDSIAVSQAKQVEQYLQSQDVGHFLTQMYDNNPRTWHKDLDKLEQCRYTVNALMRMRFCQADGKLEFKHKMNFDSAPRGYQAWFDHKERLLKNTDIFFGHWSTLKHVDRAHIYPMDHGCVWGGALSAIRLSDKKVFSVSC
ncbi:symmetrical bis(5'-nucleosyl)-tetraphosphatase [Candidatus Thioglobus sp.]|uniref:symmetrical bis(5'-nucleosyl)-tetraphosphatase n=1 Tax=Candidatus Thioglobus sp. TaxID=2026721 RepID=UPI002607383F|nr:symmetrical bis(5'-nucleosyl)-tetraphosphatase [Candidatus Thioglobus sp.]MDG2396006.1 symmetrical bis(5'-nucleosyl)-tetraphosphatase [Candidatus Thioglobus sp.]